MPRLVRLDFTSSYEKVLRGIFYLLGAFMLMGVFMLTSRLLSHDSVAEVGYWLLLGTPATFLAGWAAQRVDDTYWLDLERRNLLEQSRGLGKTRMEVVKGFDELSSVAVDYQFDTPSFSWTDLLNRSRRPQSQYALVVITRDGQKIQVSDWQVDSYPQVSQWAAQIGQWAGLTVVDEGPEKELQVSKDGPSGSARVRLQQSHRSSHYALLGLLLWVTVMLGKLFHGFLSTP